MENLDLIFQYAWVPLIGLIYKANEKTNDNLKEDTDNLKVELEKVKTKISHQMTKEDVNEVVNGAIKLLSAEIKFDSQKILFEVHQLKNQKTGKDAVTHEILDQLKILNKPNEK
jgi:hypothetical protein